MNSSSRSLSFCLPLVLWVACCARAPGPTERPAAAPAGTSRVQTAPPGGEPTAQPELNEAPAEAAVVEAEPEPQAPPPVDPVPPLVDEAGETLPQTDQRPGADSPSFEARLELLVKAIKADDPDLALPAFFPVLAYREVKAIAKPERDWEHRLVGAFKRNIHEYHQSLGDLASEVTFVGIDIPEAQVKFMKPNSEGNRIGYYRVLRSKLRFEKPDASEIGLEITSLISWRGEWYVVHLHGFK